MNTKLAEKMAAACVARRNGYAEGESYFDVCASVAQSHYEQRDAERMAELREALATLDTARAAVDDDAETFGRAVVSLVDAEEEIEAAARRLVTPKESERTSHPNAMSPLGVFIDNYADEDD